MTCRYVADIGGTHVRFALFDGEKNQFYWKDKVRNFSTFEAALAHWRKTYNLPAPQEMVIAITGWEESPGLWHSQWGVKDPEYWVLNLNDLRQNLPKKTKIDIVNDLAAAAYALPHLDPDRDCAWIHRGAPMLDAPSCVLSIGTGVGISYGRWHGDGENRHWHVQENFGGHTVPSFPGDAQMQKICEALWRRLEGEDLIYERLLGGAGLPLICEVLRGRAPGDIKEACQDTEITEIYARFLGQLIHNIAVYAHAFGGIYLAGGFLDVLVQNGGWKPDLVRAAMIRGNVPVVRKAFENLPLARVVKPDLTLFGAARKL